MVCSPVGLIGLMARALPPVIAHKGKGSNLDQALIFSGSLSTAHMLFILPRRSFSVHFHSKLILYVCQYVMDKTFTFSACVCYFFLEYNPCSIAKGGCEHFCQNNGGRVSCSCQEGFTLHPNMRNCRRKYISHMFCFVKGAVLKF